MYCMNKIIAQTVFTFGAVVYLNSGNPVNSPAANQPPTTIHNTTTPFPPPQEFPHQNSTSSSNQPEIVVFPFDVLLMPNVSKVCWPNISTTFWTMNLHTPKNMTGKTLKAVRSKFFELSDSFNEHLIRLLTTADEIKMLLNYNTPLDEFIDINSKHFKVSRDEPHSSTTTPSTSSSGGAQESNVDTKKNSRNEIPESTTANIKDGPANDSEPKSITVPILLIVILALLSYIAFLYRKLQFARYKDGQILIQDELVDPWASR